MQWEDLNYWNSGEWQVIQERLDTVEGSLSPKREDLWNSMEACPFEETKVLVIGQDPYPDPKWATGIAFSIPEYFKEVNLFPGTLKNLFKEYVKDLHYEMPKTGNLSKWCDQGVMLWNCIPTCQKKSLSHDWSEYQPLTKEIIEKLCDEDLASGEGKTVFVFIGGKARSYVKYVKEGFPVIETAHPSPRSTLSSKTPFLGSRIFSRINAELSQQNISAIDWQLLP